MSPPREELSRLRTPLQPGERQVVDFFDDQLPQEWEIYVRPRVTTKRRYSDLAIRTRSTSLSVGTDDAQRIAEFACSLLDCALRDRPGPLRLVGVGVSGLAETAQLDLLSEGH